MGRPFESELKQLKETYQEGFEYEISNLVQSLKEIVNDDIIIVGSGGSFSVASLFSVCHSYLGKNAEAVTPLKLFDRKNKLNNAVVILISASGKNNDILFAAKLSMQAQCKKIIALTMREGSKLKQILEPYTRSESHFLNFSFGSDGFLSVNSIVAYFSIILKTYNELYNDLYPKDSNLDQKSIEKELKKLVQKIDANCETISLIYSTLYEPIAIDFESKLSEAGLYNAQVSDIRNFAHGRHNWFDKKAENTVLLGFVTEKDENLANKTFDQIPDSIPKLLIKTNSNSIYTNLDLLPLLFYLVNLLGVKRNINPGRPGVPKFGRNIYNLSYQRNYLKNFNRLEIRGKKVKQKAVYSILNKLNISNIAELPIKEREYWFKKYTDYHKRITTEKYSAIVLDYDETLCSKKRRYNGPNSETANLLNRILSDGFYIGIATGRGKSVSKDLLKCIDHKFLDQIIIGYYNGGYIAKLSGDIPDKSKKVFPSLRLLYDEIKALQSLSTKVVLKLRPSQLSINWEESKNSSWVDSFIIELMNNYSDLKAVYSSHSMDIIPLKNSKLLVIDEVQKNGGKYKILKIGDSGMYPGNDFDLLSTDYSLSVDQSSLSPNKCWYLADGLAKGVDATNYYLSRLVIKSKYFQLKLR